MKLFSYIYQGDIHLNTERKVVPAEEYSRLMDSIEVLEKAKEEVEQYKKEVETQCQKLREEAQERGFQEGLAKFNEQLMGFEQELRRIRHETQKLVLPLALKAAKKIVNKELEIHPDTIVDIVIQALAPAKQNHKITIYVNKQDKDALEENKGKIKDILEQLQSLSIQERSDVSLGGCIIETETGIINASIENQWRSLEAAFERYMK
jgi:type III secretion protein L